VHDVDPIEALEFDDRARVRHIGAVAIFINRIWTVDRLIDEGNLRRGCNAETAVEDFLGPVGSVPESARARRVDTFFG
jgi:hypothetical protein